MILSRARLTAGLTLLLAVLAVWAAASGILDPTLYKELLSVGTITPFLLTGSIAQDLIALPAALLLIVLALAFWHQPSYRLLILILGLNGFFFYGYGLYVLQGQYTSLYLVYLAIFGLSLYSLILGLTSFEPSALQKLSLPRSLRLAISGFLLLILAVLVPLWIKLSLDDIARHIPSDTYGVFVLDLAVVFPAFAIIIKQLLQKQPFGYVLAGIALLKAFTICLSVAFGEWYQSYAGGLPANSGMLILFGLLCTVSSGLLVWYLAQFNDQGGGDND